MGVPCIASHELNPADLDARWNAMNGTINEAAKYVASYGWDLANDCKLRVHGGCDMLSYTMALVVAGKLLFVVGLAPTDSPTLYRTVPQWITSPSRKPVPQ